MSADGLQSQQPVGGEAPSTTPPANNMSQTVVDSELPAASIPRHCSILLGASAAVNAVQDHPLTQSAKETITSGPVAQSVKNQTTKTSNEFSGLAGSRAPPSYTGADGQPLTHYHSFFYTLLSWEHRRATGITFTGIVLFIFACRYLPIIPVALKFSAWVLAITAGAEGTAKLVMGRGIAQHIRPRRYITIPKEFLESSLNDLEQLINFFVIETQRILFAEDVAVTFAACAAAFTAYWLFKIVPFWGLTLIATCVIFLAPLIYISNREFIDEHITHAHRIVSEQANQVKDIASTHAGKGLESVQAYSSSLAAQAQDLVGTARQKIPGPTLSKSQPTTTTSIKEENFPAAPKSDLPMAPEQNAAPTVSLNGNPIAAS